MKRINGYPALLHCSLFTRTALRWGGVVSLFIASCSPAPSLPSTLVPTPTLLGTVNPPPAPSPSPTPPRDVCLFRTDANVEVGVYRFDWQNFTFTLETRIGAIIIDGPRTLDAGARNLIIVHNAELPPSFGIAINFGAGGSLIFNPANGMQEVRDSYGNVLIQNMADPTGDANGLPGYLDLVRVERAFGYYPTSVVRLYLAGVRSAPQIWTFQDVGVTLGKETYTRRSFADGRIALTVTDSQGRAKEWPGPVTVEGNVITFSLQTGVDQPVGAFTATSGGSGDAVGPFPTEMMERLWEEAGKFCP